MNSLRQDVVSGYRQLVRHPGFAAVAALTLALGIGAATAIFSVVNGVLLEPLPYPDPGRLTILWLTNPAQDIAEDVTSYPNFEEWRRGGAGAFGHVAAFDTSIFNLTGGGREPERVLGAAVTENYLQMIGAVPALGRSIRPDEHAPGRHQVIVLSDALWRRRFGADPGVIDRPVALNGLPYTVVGVLPPRAGFPSDVELWTPLVPVGQFEGLMQSRGALWLSVLGRLSPTATLASAQAQMDVVAARLEREFPDANRGMGIRLEPLHEEVVGAVRRPLLVLLGAVLLMVIIACANVANLLLARSTARRREIAVRAALGAGRARLVRQLLTESVLLAALGGACGVLLGIWGLDLLVSLAPATLPRLDNVGIDGRVLLFALGATLLTSLLFGIAPAIQSARSAPAETLKEGGRGGDGSTGHRLRGALVVVQVAVAFVLLAGAGLLVRSFVRILAEPPGFRTTQLLTLSLTLPAAKYPDDETLVRFTEALLERLRAMPGARAAGVGTSLLLSRLPASATLSVEGRPMPPPGAVQVPVTYDSVTPGFLEALDIRVVRGRGLTSRDRPDAPRVALVNEALVRRFFADRDPLGRRVTFGNPADDDVNWYVIVGVTSDARRSGLDQEPRAELYFPFEQAPERSLRVAIHADGDPARLARPAAAAVWAIDPDQPVALVRTIDEVLARSLADRRFTVALLAVFAAIAVALSAIGLYGVMAYVVARRRTEIGVRLALGAPPAGVRWMVLRQGLGLVAAGLTLGVPIALGGARLVRALLYETSPADPLTYGIIAAALALVAFAACYVPARRAMRVDPMTALRSE